MKPSGPSKRRDPAEQKQPHLKAVCALPAWKAHLSQYPEQSILTFASGKDLDAAIDLLWTDELRGLPHETPDGRSLAVPAEAVVFFTRAGLQFSVKRLRGDSDHPAEEIRELRG